MDLHLPHFDHSNQLYIAPIFAWGRPGLEKNFCLRLKVRDSVPNKYIFFQHEEKNGHDYDNSTPFHRRVTTQAVEIIHLYMQERLRGSDLCEIYIMYLRFSA